MYEQPLVNHENIPSLKETQRHILIILLIRNFQMEATNKELNMTIAFYLPLFYSQIGKACATSNFCINDVPR